MKKTVGLFVALFVVVVAAWFIGPSLLRSEEDMLHPRSEIHAAKLDGVIYVAGGIGFFRTLKSCSSFDTSTMRFSHCPDLPRHLHHVAMAAGERRIFASGGYSSLPFTLDTEGAIFALEPSRVGSQWTEIARLPEPLGQHAMAYYSGAVWLVGGDKGGEATGSLLRFDLTEGEWQEMAPMRSPRHSHAIAIEDRSLFVTGGRSKTLGSQSRVVEVYDFDSNSWSSLPDAPFDLGGHGAATFDGNLHVFGGEDLSTGTVFTRHAAIDLTNLEAGWREEKSIAFPRHGFATARIGDTAWIIGGGKRAGLRTPWSVTATAFPLPLR